MDCPSILSDSLLMITSGVAGVLRRPRKCHWQHITSRAHASHVTSLPTVAWIISSGFSPLVTPPPSLLLWKEVALHSPHLRREFCFPPRGKEVPAQTIWNSSVWEASQFSPISLFIHVFISMGSQIGILYLDWDPMLHSLFCCSRSSSFGH